MTEQPFKIIINQSVAILIDGNNIEMSLQSLVGNPSALVDFDKLIPKLLQNRGLSRLIYFREGVHISGKLADRLLNQFHGSVIPCHKSADIPLTIKATQIAQKVDTIIILSGDSDYVELVRHLRGEGVRVEIAAIRQTTARILIEEADHFTPITEEDCYILKSYNSQNTQKTPQKTSSKTPSKSSSKSATKATSKTVAKTASDTPTKSDSKISSKAARKNTPVKKSSGRTTSIKNKESSKSVDKIASGQKRNTRKTTPAKASDKKASEKKSVRKNNTTAKKATSQKTTPTKREASRKTSAKKETPKKTSGKVDNRRRRPRPNREEK